MNLKTADGVAQVRGDRERRRRPRARIRRRAVGRARRRPGARRVHREDVRARCSTTRSARVKRAFDPAGLFNPGKIVDSPPLTSNLRYGAGYADAGSGDLLRLRRARRHGPRRRNVQRPRRLPQDARRDDVPVVHGDAGGEALDARPRQHAAAGDGGPPGRRRPERPRRSRRARPVPRMPGVQGGMPGRRGRRAVQERVSRRLLAAPRDAAAARASSATSARLSEWGSRVAPIANALAGSGVGRWLNEQMLGIDRRRTPPRFVRDDVRARLCSRGGHIRSPIRHRLGNQQTAARRSVQRHLHELQPS